MYIAEGNTIDLGLVPDTRNPSPETMGRWKVCRQRRSSCEFSINDPGACIDCIMSGVRV
jgi:hypothetical protein